MPTWMYCQLNGKSAQENFYLQREEFYNELMQRRDTQAQERAITQAIEQAITDLLNGLK